MTAICAFTLGCQSDDETNSASSDAAAGGQPSSANGGSTQSGGTGTGNTSSGGRIGSGTGGAGNGGAVGAGGTGTGGTSTAGSGGAGGSSTGGASGTGATGTGGSTGTGGASTGGSSGTGGTAGATGCKRGIAANTAPGAAFFPAIAWWYNWSMHSSGANVGIEFVPMVHDAGSLNATVPAGSKYLLTFNEPNFKSQANLTAQQAASYWPTIEAKATAAGTPIVSPAVNFCGPAANCNGTDPYKYLHDFFSACSGCRVDYIAVHWYNCDVPSLKAYIEGNNNGLEGFVTFGKPIWLTEFSCDGSASVAEQEAYMRAAIPYLESNANIFRYSWFSADPIPNAKLINDDGTPTALGNVYIGLAQNCR